MSEPLYLDTTLSFEARAKDLVSHLTVEEKASLLRFNAPAHPPAGHPRLQLVERGAARRGARGHGHRIPAGDRAGRDV